jgi:3-hydroxybutyryl-CoA dehydrogenase
VDVNFEVAKSFWEQSFHEPRWQPHPIQARMVAAGRLGRKTGRGYYEYGPGHHRPDDPQPSRGDRDAPAPSADPELIEEREFTACSLMPGDLARLDPGGTAVGYVALPNLAEARLVEIARRRATTPEALAAAGRHFAALDKHVECVDGDFPGLVLGRILCQIVNEGHFAVQEGAATAPDVDTAMRLGFNWPRGPFELAEAIGPSRVVGCLDALHAKLGEERYRVAPRLRADAVSP